MRTDVSLKKALIVLLLLVAAAGLLLLWRTTSTTFDTATVRAALASLGPWGPLALILALASVLVVPVIPASILQIAAGLAFGPLVGLLAASAADVLGASAGFWLARRWGSTLLAGRLSAERNQQLTRLAGRMSWRTVMLLRLLPGPAYPLVSFAAGYSSLGFVPYTLASFAGVFPALALLVLAGDIVNRSPLLAFALVVALVGSLALAGRLLGARAAGNYPETPRG